MVAEAPHAHVDLAQSIEEQQAGHHRRVLELPLHELERRQRADVEQPAAGRCAFEQPAALVRRKGWRAMLRSQDVRDDRHELVVPAAQRIGIAAVELRDRGDGPFDIRPPLERPAVAGEQRDVELRLDVARAVAFEIEIRVPRHRRDRPLEERVRVVQEAGLTWVFERGEAAAGDRRTIDGQHPQAGLAEIGRQDQRVVPGAKDDAIVVAGGARGRWRSRSLDRKPFARTIFTDSRLRPEAKTILKVAAQIRDRRRPPRLGKFDFVAGISGNV